MARARNIKPAFFTNEDIVEIPFETRLLFIGLWTLADREGRLEDRPRRIKIELFPADTVDIDICLNQLQDHGFILRYSSGDTRYIQVLAFGKHQYPHKSERDSIIPAPVKHGTSTVQEPDRHDANPPESLLTESLVTEPLVTDGANAPETPPAKPKAKRATQIPRDFRVTDRLIEWGRKPDNSFTVEQMESQVSRFLDHWIAKGETRKDWEASFRTWMRNAKDWGHLSKTAPDGSLRRINGGKPSVHDQNTAAFAQVARELGYDDDAPDDDSAIDTSYRRRA